MIAKGVITQRANDERLPAQTIERDYILAHLCADIGAAGDSRLVFKGGTLLRLCYFEGYRYSADLDFSAIDGLTTAGAVSAVAAAAGACRARLELPTLELSHGDSGTAWVTYVGPLGSRPRTIKLDISDTELVEGHRRLAMQSRWPDFPDGSTIEGYVLDEVCAEKLRCIAERLQCRDLYDLHELLDGGYVDPLEAWHLYLRKAANDGLRGRQRTPPQEWALTFERRMTAYRHRWDEELGDYLSVDIPMFGDVERRSRRHLAPALAAARALAG
jgi:predicted nucleotidyltransferase component of viral defense system